MRIQKRIKTFFRQKQSSLRSRASATPTAMNWKTHTESIQPQDESDHFADVISVNEQMLCSQIPIQEHPSDTFTHETIDALTGYSGFPESKHYAEEKPRDWNLSESSVSSQDDSLETSLALTENTTFEEETNGQGKTENETGLETGLETAEPEACELGNDAEPSTINWPEYHETLELEETIEAEASPAASPAAATPEAARDNSVQCTPEILKQKIQPPSSPAVLDTVNVGAQPANHVEQVDEDKDHDLRVVAEEEKDVINSLTNTDQKTNGKHRRFSTISTASSIAAVIPYIWSIDETLEDSEDKVRLLPYESDNLKDVAGSLFPKRVTQAVPARKNSKMNSKHARRLDIPSLPQTSYSHQLNIPTQTVADWTSRLESSFEGCLGNSSRFELEVPELTGSKISKKSKRTRACEKLKDWAHQSCEFFTLKRHRASNSHNSSAPPERSVDRVPCPSLDQSWASRDTSIENIQQLSTIDESWIANTKLCEPHLSIFESFDSFKLAPIEPENSSQWHSFSRYFKRTSHTVS